MNPNDYRLTTLEDVYDKYEGFVEYQKAEKYEEWERMKILAMYNLFQPAYKFKGNINKNLRNPYEEKQEVDAKPRSMADVDYLTNYWNTLKYKRAN